MKIKRPSVKGIKNMKYLGHFAQDKYIQKGHNLSGQFPMFRQPSQLEMMGPANPFDVTEEFKRREAQLGQNLQQIQQEEQILAQPDESVNLRALAPLYRNTGQQEQAQQAQERNRARAQRRPAVSARRKFLTEL